MFGTILLGTTMGFGSLGDLDTRQPLMLTVIIDTSISQCLYEPNSTAATCFYFDTNQGTRLTLVMVGEDLCQVIVTTAGYSTVIWDRDEVPD